jgi:hypothetical protein
VQRLLKTRRGNTHHQYGRLKLLTTSEQGASMTQTEALRLALEFIPSISPAFICEASHHKKHEQHASNEPCPHVAKQKQVYEAIKAALEAKVEFVAVYGYCPVCGAKGTSRERHPDGNTTCVNGHKYKSRDTLSTPPQQEAKDEPVGKLQKPTGERAWFTISELNAWADKKLSENPHWVMPKDEPERDDPPPQRTWVGLTNEKVEKMWDFYKPSVFDFYVAIESELKDKNYE